MPQLPFQQLPTQAAPSIVDRETWLAACDDLLSREKAHTREGDAIAAARRRLPMTGFPRTSLWLGPTAASRSLMPSKAAAN